jgi:hypothetical protein
MPKLIVPTMPVLRPSLVDMQGKPIKATDLRYALYRDPYIGNVYAPKALRGMISLPGSGPLRSKLREVGINVMTHRRPLVNPETGEVRWVLIAHDVQHNERVDRGAVRQDLAVFGSTSMAMTIVAVASAALTKTKTDESLGVITASVSTNEFTTIGLSRAAGSLGTYTAPASLGAVFTRLISKVFTSSGSGTAKGSGLFDSATVSGSFLYVEDNHTDAVLVTSDQLTESWSISN